MPIFRDERATELMSEGLISKAFQGLKNAETPQRLVQVNEEVLETLQRLHPTRQEPFKSDWIEETAEEIGAPQPTMEQIHKIINGLKAHAKPGLMQFRTEHIQELANEKGGARYGQNFLKDFTRFINLICKGNKLPKSYHAFLAACQLVPLPKGVTDIRPIAIPHLARKIAEKCMAEIFAGDFERHFRGLQFGVATPNGMEKIIHEMAEAKKSNPENDIILLDSENAFNNMDRDAAIQEIKSAFPEILPYVLSTYNQSTNLFLAMDDGSVETLASTMGAHQGAPLGSLIYSAGQHPLLRGVSEILKTKENAKARGYIDDTSVQGHIDDIEDGLNYLVRESPKFGIKFKNEKIKIFIGECSQQEAQERIERYQHIFGNRIPLANFSLPDDAPHTRGINVMNIPIGTNEYIQANLMKVWDEIQKDCEVIRKVQQLQQRWTYMYYILGGKINHLSRVVHCSLMVDIARKFQNLKKQLVEEILNAKTDDFQWFQMQLGTSVGGCGLKSDLLSVGSAHHASRLEYVRYKVKLIRSRIKDPKAWLINILQSNEKRDTYVKNILGDALRIRRTHGDPTRNKDTYEWTEQDRGEPPDPFPEEPENEIDWLVRIIFVETKPLQHLFYSLHYKKTANAYVKEFFAKPTNSNANKARFRSASGKHAGKWVQVIPREGFWMSSKEFRIALCLRLGLDVHTKNYKCSCGGASADESQHYLTCKLGNQKNNRHNSIVGVFCKMFKETGQTVATEVHLDEDNLNDAGGRRSDITLKRQNDMTGLSHHQEYDVTVRNPSCKSYTEGLKSHQFNGVTARRAHNQKITDYCDIVNKEDFHPLAFEAFGCWTKEVTDLVKSTCKDMAEETDVPYSVLVNFWFQKLSFVLQWENAVTVIEREDFSKNVSRKTGTYRLDKSTKFEITNFKRYNVRPR
jgi:hypothetical protein